MMTNLVIYFAVLGAGWLVLDTIQFFAFVINKKKLKKKESFYEC